MDGMDSIDNVDGVDSMFTMSSPSKLSILPTMSIVCLMLIFLPLSLPGDPYVTARLWGRLGNQLFIIAAATSVALDHGAVTSFPDFMRAFSDEGAKMEGNYARESLKASFNAIFNRLDTSMPSEPVEFIYREPSFTYAPIPYHPNMLLEGWFQSDKYFKHHKQEILALFAPSDEMVRYLRGKYSDIIDHPHAVSVHLRCYFKEDRALERVYPTYGRDYVIRAMKHFPKALFVVFSDQIAWAKEQLAGLPGTFRFIEKESLFADFYLMSMCKHNIISNSSFSWWAAYLNANPNKVVLLPLRWFSPEYMHNSNDLVPEGWRVVPALRCLP